MPAYSFETADVIANWFGTAHRAQLSGIAATMVSCSAATGALCGERSGRIHAAQGGVTRTDSPILFSVTRS